MPWVSKPASSAWYRYGCQIADAILPSTWLVKDVKGMKRTQTAEEQGMEER